MPQKHARAPVGITVTTIRAHGRDAIAVRSRIAEILIVPAWGRVMSFGLRDPDSTRATKKQAHQGRADTGRGPFWSHPEIDRGIQPDGEGWTNYGGDKAWPAPQSDWPKVAGRGWPPPKGFDAAAHTATLDGGRVQLLSPVDRDYGIRVRRTIELDADKPIMTTETTYEKVSGSPVRVAVWTISQLAAPDRLFVLLPAAASAAFPAGYRSLMPDAPSKVTTEGRLLSLGHDERNKTMIASDGRALLWVGKGPDLLVELLEDAPSNPDARSQIYTSPSATDLAYVELELLGSARSLAVGEKISARQRYTLISRTESEPGREARKVFGVR